MTPFGDRLKTARLAHGLTQTKAEDFAGMGYRTWTDFEARGRLPSMTTLLRMHAVIPRTNLHWLVTGDGDEFLDEARMAA